MAYLIAEGIIIRSKSEHRSELMVCIPYVPVKERAEVLNATEEKDDRMDCIVTFHLKVLSRAVIIN